MERVVDGGDLAHPGGSELFSFGMFAGDFFDFLDDIDGRLFGDRILGEHGFFERDGVDGHGLVLRVFEPMKNRTSGVRIPLGGTGAVKERRRRLLQWGVGGRSWLVIRGHVECGCRVAGAFHGTQPCGTDGGVAEEEPGGV